MIGKFAILGEIGSYEDEQGNTIKGVDLMDVVTNVEQFRKLGLETNDPVTSFEIEVNGPGGFVDVGFQIHDYLVSIPERVKTIAVEVCASIDTIIFLAGDDREAKCPLLIHNPWLSNVNGDAAKLQAAAEHVKGTEDEIVSFYSKYTKIGKVALSAFMKNETYIYPDMAFMMGFTTVAPTTEISNTPIAYKAVAKINEPMSKETKSLLEKMDEFIVSAKAFMAGEKPKHKAKALVVAEQGGKSLEITKPDGTDITGAPMAGDMVMIDGAPGEGSFILPDMELTIVVTAGVITAVTPNAVDATKQLEAANAKIAALEKENSESKAALDESTKDVETLKIKFTEIETTLKAMTGADPKLPDPKNQFRKPEDEKTMDEIKKEKESRKEKYRKD